jgi:hypothetical protein
MTAPAYTTDLVDIREAESGESWTEPAGATGGGVPSAETDYYIQKAACFSKSMAVAGGGLCGQGNQAAASVIITSPAALFMWVFFGCPNTLDTLANGGLRIIMGQDKDNYQAWYVKGAETYIYGGWINIAVDPSVGYQASQGSPSGVWQYFGAVAKTLATISKGSPFGVDVFRYGRTLQVAYGESANYGTFVGAAAKNDANDATAGYNRWGLFQAIDGGYLMKGLFLMGTSGTAVDFRDANRNIAIQDTIRVAAEFNTFEVRNISSRVDWTNISIAALGSTSKGRFIVTDNADVNKDGCVFTDMDAFTYLSNSTILDTVYRRCGLVTQGGAVFTGCVFQNATGAVSLKVSNPSLVTGCLFTSDGSNHAVEADTPGDFDWDNELVGYATEHGSSGNEAFYNNSGGHINLTVVGGTAPKYRNGSGASTTIIIPDVTLTISAPVSLVGAEIRIYDMNATLPDLGDELAGTESHNAATYAFSGAASNAIWIQIMLAGYEEFGQQVTMPTANGSFYALLKKELNA